MKLLKLFPAFVVLVQLVLSNAGQAVAQYQLAVELENVVALVSFGEKITFVATVKSPLPVQDASILIQDESLGATHVEPITVQADGRTEYQFDVRQKNVRPFSKVSFA